MTPARFRWGMLLVLAGVLLMLRNLDVITDDCWAELLRWSPVLLIAIGIEKIFTGSRLRFISYLSSIVLVAAAVGLAMEFESSGSPDKPSHSTYRQRHIESVELLSAAIEAEDAIVEIRGAGDDLVTARFADYVRRPRTEFTVDDDRAEVLLASRAGKFFGGIVMIDLDELESWRVGFSNRVPLRLDCFGSGSEFHLDLSENLVQELNLDADDALVYIRLGRLEPGVQVEISGIDTDLELVVPKSSGLRMITTEAGSFFTTQGLYELDGDYINRGYDTLDNKIEVNLLDPLSSFRLIYDETL
jgi:hypothetical protein